MPRGEWIFWQCGEGPDARYFRTNLLVKHAKEPRGMEILNFVILPALTMVNVTPCEIGVDLHNEAQPRARRTRAGGADSSSDAPPLLTSPGSALHVYHMNGLRPIHVRICEMIVVCMCIYIYIYI